jgi:hypothetical protein
MGIQRHHVILTSAWLVVVVFAGLGIAFMVTASQTNRTYNALTAHHVTVSARVQGCAYAGGTSNSNQTPYHLMCRVDYGYKGLRFNNLVPAQQHYVFLVDPENTSVRMSETNFKRGPEAIAGSITFGIVFLVLAVGVAIVHLRYIARRRAHHIR